METFLSLGFMLFGLGFFVFIMRFCFQQDTVEYERMLNERREFGYVKQKRKTRKAERKELREL